MNTTSTPARGTVAIVGIGLVAPGVNDPPQLWQVLHGQTSTLCQPEHFDVSRWFDPDRSAPDKTYVRTAGFLHSFTPHPRLAREQSLGYWEGADRTTLLLRHSLLQAMDGVIVGPDDRLGAYVGAQPGGLGLEDAILLATAAHPRLSPTLEQLRARYPHAPARPSDAFPDRLLRAACRDLLPEGSDLLVVDTACSSSLYAVDLGVKSLLAGERDVVFCGGANTGSRRDLVLFAKLQGLSATGEIRAFDRDATGVLFSDAAAVLALKMLDRALADGDEIHGLVGGFGGSSDGEGSVMASSPRGQRLAIDRARAVCAVEAGAVDWIVAHGTGTPVGDDVELETLTGAAGPGGVWCTSNKPLIGHGAWAAGAINVVHAVLAMRHGEIPAQRYFTVLPDSVHADRIRIPLEPVPWPVSAGRRRVAGVCAYGFGGTNAHLLVQAADPGVDAPRMAAPTHSAHQDDPMVLVGHAVHVPGGMTHDAIAGWLGGELPAPPRSFGEQYPLPPLRELRMPPVSARSVDRTHLMALAAVANLVTEYGSMWEHLRERSGVFTAHTGPTRCMTDYTIRVGADDLHAAVATPPSGDVAWLDEGLAALRQRLPEANDRSMTGQLTNIISAMVVNRYRLNGSAMNIDCGRSSTQGALHAAERYLRSQELDFALVIGLHGNSTPLLAELSGTPVDQIAEAAVVLALTRRSVAERHGWSFDAVIRSDAARTGRHAGIPGVVGRCYFGADGALGVLRALHRAGTGPIVLQNLDPAPRVEIQPTHPPAEPLAPAPGRRHGVRRAAPPSGTDTPPQANHPVPVTDSTINSETMSPRIGSPSPVRDRSVVVLRRVDVERGTEPRAAITSGTLVLTHSADLAYQLDALAVETDSRVVCTDPETAGNDRIIVVGGAGTRAAVDAVRAAIPGGVEHVLIVASARVPQADWPAPPSPELLAMQEYALAAAAAFGDRPGPAASVTALLLDPLRLSVVHPHLTMITGFLRGLAHELPCPVYGVVTDAALTAGIEQLSRESAAVRDATIVYYRQGLRYLEQLCSAPLPDTRRAGPLPWTDRPVIVATGGARGATAVVVTALARRVHPVLWLLGTTPPDAAPADLLAAADGELRAKRTEYLSRERTRDPAVSVAILNQRFDAMVRAREIHHTLRRLEQLCGTDNVHYLVCDLREREQVTRAAKSVHAKHGRVDLLIHGAGRIRSAAVADKSLAHFREVRDIKVAGYHHLKEAFADPAPALWCNFGSGNAMRGCAGDTDYVAANEYLCAAARYGDGTEFTPAWGLWTETGMVCGIADELSREHGFTGISNTDGADLLLAELALPRPLDVVPFYGVTDSWTRPPGPVGPLLGDPDTVDHVAGTWTWRPDPVRDSYLTEHLIDRRPVLPAAMMLAMAADAALRLHPGTQVTALTGTRIEAPLYTDVRAAGCRITAETSAGGEVRVELRSDVLASDGRILACDRLHCRVDVHVGNQAPSPPAPPAREMTALAGDPAVRPDTCAQLSGVWRTIHHPAADAAGAAALCLPQPQPHTVFARLPIPALLLDSAFRLFGYPPQPDGTHIMAVPSACDRIDLYTADTDVVLAQRYPAGIPLSYDSAQQRAVAATDDGATLLTVTGLTIHTVDSLPAHIPYQEWQP
ncbi:SDR family NAD(P)-dependent oxidoreductase [Nocardia ninae]|uniref:Uncharacterized protein n=1 Tax=Nocardia ninae NBRC 108245 TaxID=1210091 RepID=A0A511MJ43_9NOCA|nr:SDR family NAD(P)-dependent oxidoreductase [Nocardia ninae]GEM39946.1 hypothetical protein NN4_44650 [Nocardia ninae NBRC 108245]